MTPNLNTSPLAALIANATKTSAGSDSPLNPGAALAGGAEDNPNPKNQFIDILHIHKGQFSSELENNMVGEQALFPAVSNMHQAIAQGLAQGQVQLAPGITPSGQPVPGMTIEADAVKALSHQKQALNHGLESVLADQELTVQPHTPAVSLAVSVTGQAPLVADPAAGGRSPQGGNSLPHSVQTGHAGQLIGLETDGKELTQAGLLARTVSSTVAPAPTAVQHPAHHLVSDGLAPPVPVPEFMEQLAKFPKPAPGVGIGGASPGLIQGLQGVSELANSVSDVNTAAAELNRGNALVAAPERQAAVQPALAPMPLSRLTGAPGWDQSLGQRILWMVDNGLNKAELRLDPPHLGSVNVRISMQDDQAQLLFQAAHPAARDALESALPRLREMFAQQGLELGNADVSDQNEPSAGGDADRESEQLADDSSGQLRDSTLGQADHDGSPVDSGRLPGIDPSDGNSLIDEFV